MLTKGCEWGAKLRSTAVVQQTFHLRLCLHNKVMVLVLMMMMKMKTKKLESLKSSKHCPYKCV